MMRSISQISNQDTQGISDDNLKIPDLQRQLSIRLSTKKPKEKLLVKF